MSIATSTMTISQRNHWIRVRESEAYRELMRGNVSKASFHLGLAEKHRAAIRRMETSK